MKLFLDTASIEEIRTINAWGVLGGVTTNPSLLAREGTTPRRPVEGDLDRGRRATSRWR